ncbi:GNAT family N-acetyltransferase [Actinoalloteichus sp. AHMU CJ021]|uniref:Acetyltransferase n=1 Tax=Actinoalloteichus caeruleus DSM 43889 TaxID=1120930 RepID=A0ABT1JCV4_ACTCY|nr:GNAT family N-acetyltransferase [Actinoalloteichus caeruleus]AUS80674.1 GNAT family N-acetyltransferase [Actinoalloteichus sp. AHMU CJ021]MCP2330059.1 putative acetyltransferase [Actinoalloteichus caeruleus DSM 43889]
MTRFDVEPVPVSRIRETNELFRTALHAPVSSDEKWELAARSYQTGRTWGVLDEGEYVGTASSFGALLRVPGGAEVPMAAVSRVAVRADHTRRGILTELMRTQLTDAARRGEPTATLRASETAIYGRFGYGVADRSRSVQVRADRARIGDLGGEGTVRLLRTDQLATAPPEIYAGFGPYRTGMISRPAEWWVPRVEMPLKDGRNLRGAVHTGSAGHRDGYVLYEVKVPDDAGFDGAVLTIHDLHAPEPAVRRRLWRFLLTTDLVGTVEMHTAPVDEPLEWWVGDPRAVRTKGIEDATWLRLTDVPAALAARSYGNAEPVVLEVRDSLLPDNSGCYRVTAEGAARTDADPDLRLSSAALAALYQGDVRVSVLATAGLVEVLDGAALARADVLLGAEETPWCGTYF